MYDIIPTNQRFIGVDREKMQYINRNNEFLTGEYSIIASSQQYYVENMFDNNKYSFWESDIVFEDKIDDPITSNTVTNLDSGPCQGDDYLAGTCNNLYTGLNNSTAFTKFFSNDSDDSLVTNKITTNIKGESIEIIIPQEHYVFELHLHFIKNYAPKRYFFLAYDEELKKYILLNSQLNLHHEKEQDILPINPTKKYKKYKVVFNTLSENKTIRISKLQLIGDVDLGNAPNSKYTYNTENFSNMNKKKVRFSNIKYIYEYEKFQNRYSIKYLPPFILTSLLFFIFLKKK